MADTLPSSELPPPDRELEPRRRRLRGPLFFGVVAATLEMAVILWFMYC